MKSPEYHCKTEHKMIYKERKICFSDLKRLSPKRTHKKCVRLWNHACEITFVELSQTDRYGKTISDAGIHLLRQEAVFHFEMNTFNPSSRQRSSA